jgi:hypothetical protein
MKLDGMVIPRGAKRSIVTDSRLLRNNLTRTAEVTPQI